MALSMRMMADTRGISSSPPDAQYFANAGLEYMEKYDAEAHDFAEIARISYAHSAKHPYAQFRDVYTLEQIEKARMIHFPLAKLQCSPTSDGAGAAVLVSQKFLDERSHSPQLYSKSSMDLAGYDMTKRAAQAALNEAGVSAKDIKVAELYDCFSANELVLLEGLGFSEPGKAHMMVRNGDITDGGKRPIINPSGGLISKGHPLGATSLA
jgi:sterol carrier protein 2